MRIETDSQHYTDIAEAIRVKNGTENTYYPEEMAPAVLAIPQETYDVYAPIIYSLEEREVGVWTDGKPLYERVFDFSTALSIQPSNWTLTNIDSTNIEKIVYCTGLHSDGTCYAFIGADPTQNTHSKVGIWSTRSTTVTLKGLILQYTKISDVAGSGSWGTDGVPMVHYDGTERIIGTWFGETLYQKSFNLTIPNQSGDYLFPNTAIPNWNFTVNVDWTINGRGPRTATPWLTQYTMYLDEFSANGLYFYFQGTANAGLSLHVTVQYTKTSS